MDDYLAIPYILTMECVERDGDWLCHAAFPELPGCEAEAPTVEEALQRIEEERVARIVCLLQAGEPVPVPRSPLRPSTAAFEGEYLRFTRWLVQHGRLSG